MRGPQLNSMLVPRGPHTVHVGSMWVPRKQYVGPTWALHEQYTSPCVNSAPAPCGATTHERAPILGALVYVLNFRARVPGDSLSFKLILCLTASSVFLW